MSFGGQGRGLVGKVRKMSQGEYMRVRLLTAAAALALPITVLTTGPATAAMQYTVSATAHRTSVLVDHKITFSGHVSPSYSSQRVSLQQRVGKSWRNMKSVIVNGGDYTLKYAPTAPGVFIYRVFAARHKSVASGASARIKVKVYGWRYLSDLESTGVDPNGYWNAWSMGSIEINGVFYPHTLYQHYDDTFDQPIWIEYNLRRGCSTFEAVEGLGDNSTSADSDHFEILADGAERSSQSMTFGSSSPIQLRIAGALRLRLQLEEDQYTSGDDYPAFGNARILCHW